jgi:hypothetical protein
MSRTNRHIKTFATLAGLTVVAVSLTGCNNAGQGLLSGGALGAGAGAIIGSLSGNAGTGAAIGAVAGGLGGAVIGDQNERRSYQSYQGGPYYAAPAPAPVYAGTTYYAYPTTTVYTYREYYHRPYNYYECQPRGYR